VEAAPVRQSLQPIQAQQSVPAPSHPSPMLTDTEREEQIKRIEKLVVLRNRAMNDGVDFSRMCGWLE
jgi:hypothetical protein